jgi:glycine betaine/proline transport system permease protein
LAYLIAVTGQWEKAMITVYLCGISVVLACLIGIPIGMYTASSKRLWAWVEAAIDTLQTLPSFVYLMPAVMLFRVGDFTAMLAVVAYAVSPVIRYTALGLQRVPDNLIEAGRANGCTEWQLMTKIRLKLAMPEIMLGINQTVMLALSMLVITALVGTRDLGQEVYIALDQGRHGPWSGCRSCGRLHCHHRRPAHHCRLAADARPAWSFNTGGDGMTAAQERIAGLDIWSGLSPSSCSRAGFRTRAIR